MAFPRASSPILTLTLAYGALHCGVMAPCAWAQSQPDGSLGGEASVMTSQGAQDLVTGGAVRSRGLFHSFETLNVGEGRSLYFANPDGIEQIFSRVTGNRPSNIDGILGVLGNADLFLLNPNGILFGPNSQLDLAGSFTASTAASLQFEGFEFSTTVPQSVPLLSIGTPVGINFGGNPGPIVNHSLSNGVGLSVGPSRSLSLLGGDILLDRGAITAADGRIELYSQGDLTLKNQSMVGMNHRTGNPESEIRLRGETITLEGQSGLLSGNASDGAGANIVLEAQNLTVMDGSQISTVTLGSGDGGTVLAKIPGQITLTSAARNGTIGNPSFILTTTLGSGTGGDIQLETGDLLTEYNGFLSSQTGVSSTGLGGEVTIQATRSIAGQYSSPTNGLGGGILVDTRGSGAGGNLIIQTPQLTLQDQHVLFSLSWLSGQGGDIQVEADQVQLSNASTGVPGLAGGGIRSIVYGSGNGGDVEITTQGLTVQTGALVSSVVEVDREDWIRGASVLDPSLLELLDLPDINTGDAGNMNIVADTILVDGFNPFLPAVPSQISSITQGGGSAGDVNLTSRELKLLNGGAVVSSSIFPFSTDIPLNSGRGDGGNLTVNADDIVVSGSNPMTELSSFIGTQTGSFGDAGNTVINSRQIAVLDGGLVSSGTLAWGNGGILTINAQESITVDGINANGQVSTIGTFAFAPSEALGLFFSLPLTPQGKTGQLVVNGDRLTLSRGGTLSVAHEGMGDAGTLQVNVNQLRLNQAGQLSATSFLGEGGNVELNVNEILALRQGSQISATALGGQGDGGNLEIVASLVLAIPNENSDIIANAKGGGNGGTISLQTDRLFGLELQRQLTPRSDITASSEVGLNGTVNIDLLTTDPSPGLTNLPTTLFSPGEQVSTACNSRARSRFVTTGRGGLALDPRQQLSQFPRLEDWRETMPNRLSSGERVASATQRRSPSPFPTESPLPPVSSAASPIVEAQGWERSADGTIRIIVENTEYYNEIVNTAATCSPFTAR